MIVISKTKMWPIQVWLREMITNASQVGMSQEGADIADRVKSSRDLTDGCDR
jgi:hypothetical protein